MRRLVTSLLLLGAIAYGSTRWYQHRLEVGGPDTGVEVVLPAGFEPLLAQIELIRPLHEKKRPNQPGDWLERFPEGGQTFGQYVQFRGRTPLRDEYQTIYVQPLGEFDETQQRLVEQTAEFMGHFFGMPVQSLETRPLGDIPETARRMRDDEEQVLSTWIMNDILKPQRPEDAVAALLKAHDAGDAGLIHLNGDPLIDSLRRDARVIRLLQQLGFA